MATAAVRGGAGTGPDPYRWTVLAVGAGAQAATAAFYLGIGSIAPALRDQFGLSLAELGLLLACPTGGLLATLVVWGRLSDTIGERAVMTAGTAAAAALLASASRVHDAVALGAILSLAGAAAASVNAASGRAVMTWFPTNGRGIAMGVRQCAVPAGAAVAALVLPLLASSRGVAGAGDAGPALMALAAGCLSAAVAVAVLIREPASPPGPVVSAAGAPSGPVPSMIRDRRLLRLAAASGLLVLPQFALLMLLVELLHEHKGMSPGAAALVLALAQAGAAAGRLLAGWHSDRTASRLRPLRTIAVVTAAVTALLATLVAAPTVVLAAGAVLAAAVASSWNGLAFTAAGELAPPGRTGTALGVQNTANFAAATVAPPAIAVVVTVAGWPAALLVLAAAGASSALLLAPLVESRSAAAA